MEQPPIQVLAKYLQEWMDEPADVQYEAIGADAVIRVGKARFLVAYDPRSDAACVRRALDTLKLANDDDYIPVVAVGHMGAVGERICRSEGVSWIDLSGNADIRAHRLRILITGKRNRSESRTGLSDVFAPKSSRVSRFLLQYPFLPIRQTEICERIHLSSSFVSRIVARLEANGFVRKLSDGSIICDNPDRLLDAWDASYSVEKHHIRSAHIATKSGELLIKIVRRGLEGSGMSYAFTGRLALGDEIEAGSIAIVPVFVSQLPEESMITGLKLDNASDPNVLFLVPDDEGIFHGAHAVHGFMCVHPVQAYLDGKGLRPPATEARKAVRTTLFSKGSYEAGI